MRILLIVIILGVGILLDGCGDSLFYPDEEVSFLKTDDEGNAIGAEQVKGKVCNSVDLDYHPTPKPKELQTNNLSGFPGWLESSGWRPCREPTILPPFPNPALVSTTIPYCLPGAEYVVLAIVDKNCDVVRRLVDGWRPAGSHSVEWDLRNQKGYFVKNGVYSVCLEAGHFLIRTVLQVKK